MYNQLTQKDIDAMQAEIEERKVVIRPKLLEAVKEARAHGDLSENFEYYAAKREKNKNEIGMNTKVTVMFEEDQAEETYKIVTTMRGNSLEGLISVESPIGKALMGHKEGDRVYVEVNAGYGYYLLVKKIEKNPDEEEDKLRSF